jgi:serine/threonine protein kinase
LLLYQVLINPATQLQESSTVTLADLAAKNIRPFCSKVDIWAVGVLAYELIAGRPPFEVADEAKTVTRIIYDHDLKFPSTFPEALRDFVKHALIKDPNSRPGASKLLTHPW